VKVVVEPSGVNDCLSNAPYAGSLPKYAIFYLISFIFHY